MFLLLLHVNVSDTEDIEKSFMEKLRQASVGNILTTWTLLGLGYVHTPPLKYLAT